MVFSKYPYCGTLTIYTVISNHSFVAGWLYCDLAHRYKSCDRSHISVHYTAICTQKDSSILWLRLIVDCSVLFHRNIKPFLIKKLQVTSFCPFIYCFICGLWNFLSLHVVLSSTLKVFRSIAFTKKTWLLPCRVTVRHKSGGKAVCISADYMINYMYSHLIRNLWLNGGSKIWCLFVCLFCHTEFCVWEEGCLSIWVGSVQKALLFVNRRQVQCSVKVAL
jgi:hypothetical protein